MNKTLIRYCLAIFLSASAAGMTFAGRMEPPAGIELSDLTDDATQMSARYVSKGMISGSSQATAFDIVGDVPSALKKMNDLQKQNTRFGGSGSLWVVYGFITPQVVNAYRIYNQIQLDTDGSDCRRQSPRDFYLEGSQTALSNSWVVLDSVKNESEWKPLEARYFECDNATAYSYYRIRFISSHGDSNIVVQEMELFSVPCDTLAVVGVPGDCGDATPAYGLYRMEKGEAIELTAPAQINLHDGLQVATCLGWAVRRATGTEFDAWETLAEGVGNIGTFVHPGGCCRWEWKFEISSLLDGDVIFVGPNGSDVNSGRVISEPKWTIAEALGEFSNNPESGKRKTVCILPGIYEIRNEIQVTNDISVVGLTGNPQDVTVRNVTNATSTASKRVFVLNSPRAFISGLTMENGQSLGNGGNAAILSDGGIISNCVMRGGMVRKTNGRGAGVYLDSDAALVTHNRFEDGSLGSGSTSATDGTGAYVVRGQVSNCLFIHNAMEGIYQGLNASGCSVVRLCGGLLDNCTVVDNCHTGLVAAVYAESAAKVVNCVMAGTRTTGDLPSPTWAGESSAFVNCATDDAEPINDTCIAGNVSNMFIDYKNGNYCPKGGGILQDGGTADGIALPATDFIGEKRVRGKAIDIGCCESAPRNFLIRIR